MKKLEQKSVYQLLAIIPNHPATRIMHFSDGGKPFCYAIKSFCKERTYEYQLNISNENFLNEIKEEYSVKGLSSTKLIQWDQRRYASMARLYDFLFITVDVPQEYREPFIKNVFHHIKSAGNIILFLPKNDRQIVQEWWEILEENLFVAMNTIDMFENYEILIAKKMHGWGGTH